MNSGVINLEPIMKNPAAHCRVSIYNGHSLLSLRGAKRRSNLNTRLLHGVYTERGECVRNDIMGYCFATAMRTRKCHCNDNGNSVASRLSDKCKNRHSWG